ncbi:MAG: MerR family transcriptional regulator [Acidobacteriales bacterium]|nr:MerR family transcriptional regulator [Terriglobales bacterium]
MLSVTQIARRCGLSRTTILYYESCGLLRPATRSTSNYRLYGEKQVALLERIRMYRSLGLSVADIRELLTASHSGAAALLQRRMRELDSEIVRLRNHQQAILRLLNSKRLLRKDPEMTKQKWTQIMKSAGFTEADMHRWHREFERSAPEDHEEFLGFLHIPPDEIKTIRDWSRKPQQA